METTKTHQASACPLMSSRRSFLRTSCVSAAALQMGLFDFASSVFAARRETSAKPVIRVGFIRPDVKEYWLGWPGAAYDIAGHQVQYKNILNKAAEELGVKLEIQDKPLHDAETVNEFIGNVRKSRPDGVFSVMMSLNEPAWENAKKLAGKRGDVPMIVFSPMGTSFTGHLQRTRGIEGVFTAATHDLEWMGKGLRMLKVVWQMKNTRLCILKGDKTEDKEVEGLGTTLHYIPLARFAEEFEKADTTDEMRSIAYYYENEARNIVEPSSKDILNAAKNYVVARRIMADENCDGISVDCLPPVGRREIWPPCLAWSRLRDEGVVAACEADTNAALASRLTHLLFDRPGFMQDPAPDPVNNTLMGAHCACATRLDGFDKPHEPFILRSHSESNIGVATQVLWRIGQKVTVMDLDGPKRMLLGTGRVLRNIDTPPAGGCRTSVELEMDDVSDVRDIKGFHQLFIYGDLENAFKAYCQLAKIEVVHI